MFTGIIKFTGKVNKIYKTNNNCTVEILFSILPVAGGKKNPTTLGVVG